jgi:hypothetical protein
MIYYHLKCKCKRCGYEWNSRVKSPVRCASCRSPYWNLPYVRNISEDFRNPGSYMYISSLPFNGVLGQTKVRISAGVKETTIAADTGTTSGPAFIGRKISQSGTMRTGLSNQKRKARSAGRLSRVPQKASQPQGKAK